MACVLGADGRKIGSGPRCQRAPALELTGCVSMGVWGILPLRRAHCPCAAPLPAFEGAQHEHHSPLAISWSGLPPSEPFFCGGSWVLPISQPWPSKDGLCWVPLGAGQLPNLGAALWGHGLGEQKPGPAWTWPHVIANTNL